MNKRFHELKIEAFVQATEDRSRVTEAIVNLVGDLEKWKEDSIRTEGLHGNPITYLIFSIRKEKEILRILDMWKDREFWSRGLEHLDDRLDDSMVYHLRVDKMSAFQDSPRIWNGGESLEIKLKVATYPASREESKKILISV